MEKITKIIHKVKQWNWDSNPGLTLDLVALGPLNVKFCPRDRGREGYQESGGGGRGEETQAAP